MIHFKKIESKVTRLWQMTTEIRNEIAHSVDVETRSSVSTSLWSDHKDIDNLYVEFFYNVQKITQDDIRFNR